ncbi:hypothetical protein HDU96_008562 [Phlyctochytrium bullatum]|nr:hypothetical protein HDU96_008562 [Phlyctochytrium bullatum]
MSKPRTDHRRVDIEGSEFGAGRRDSASRSRIKRYESNPSNAVTHAARHDHFHYEPHATDDTYASALHATSSTEVEEVTYESHAYVSTELSPRRGRADSDHDDPMPHESRHVSKRRMPSFRSDDTGRAVWPRKRQTTNDESPSSPLASRREVGGGAGLKSNPSAHARSTTLNSHISVRSNMADFKMRLDSTHDEDEEETLSSESNKAIKSTRSPHHDNASSYPASEEQTLSTDVFRSKSHDLERQTLPYAKSVKSVQKHILNTEGDSCCSMKEATIGKDSIEDLTGRHTPAVAS